MHACQICGASPEECRAAVSGGVSWECLAHVAGSRCSQRKGKSAEAYSRERAAPDTLYQLHVETLARLPQAIAIYHKNKIEFGPAKAANAGGVAVSGLEMAQNSARLSWSKEEVDDKLKGIMKSIFNASKEVRLTDFLVCANRLALCDKASRAWTSSPRADPTPQLALASLDCFKGRQKQSIFVYVV